MKKQLIKVILYFGFAGCISLFASDDKSVGSCERSESRLYDLEELSAIYHNHDHDNRAFLSTPQAQAACFAVRRGLSADIVKPMVRKAIEKSPSTVATRLFLDELRRIESPFVASLQGIINNGGCDARERALARSTLQAMHSDSSRSASRCIENYEDVLALNQSDQTRMNRRQVFLLENKGDFSVIKDNYITQDLIAQYEEQLSCLHKMEEMSQACSTPIKHASPRYKS